MSKVSGLLLLPNGTRKDVTCDAGSFDDLRQHVDFQWFDVVRTENPEVSVFVDDEGLLKKTTRSTSGPSSCFLSLALPNHWLAQCSCSVAPTTLAKCCLSHRMCWTRSRPHPGLRLASRFAWWTLTNACCYLRACHPARTAGMIPSRRRYTNANSGVSTMTSTFEADITNRMSAVHRKIDPDFGRLSMNFVLATPWLSIGSIALHVMFTWPSHSIDK